MCVSVFWPWLPNLCAFVIFLSGLLALLAGVLITIIHKYGQCVVNTQSACLPASACCMQRTQSSDKLIALSDSPTPSYQLQSPVFISSLLLGPACLVRNETNICAIANANFPI